MREPTSQSAILLKSYGVVLPAAEVFTSLALTIGEHSASSIDDLFTVQIVEDPGMMNVNAMAAQFGTFSVGQ